VCPNIGAAASKLPLREFRISHMHSSFRKVKTAMLRLRLTTLRRLPRTMIEENEDFDEEADWNDDEELEENLE
jgi:hypothetical protein